VRNLLFGPSAGAFVELCGEYGRFENLRHGYVNMAGEKLLKSGGTVPTQDKGGLEWGTVAVLSREKSR
jgi:hypothetical protein